MKVSLQLFKALVLIIFFFIEISAGNKILERQDAVDEDHFDSLDYYNDEVRYVIFTKIQSKKIEEKLDGLQMTRLILSHGKHSPFEDFVDDGIIPLLVKSLNSTNTTIQCAATYSLANIAFQKPEYAKEIVDENIVPILRIQMHSHDVNVSVESLRAIGNIIYRNPELRDYMLNLAILENLHALIDTKTPLDVLKKVTWVVSVICTSEAKKSLSQESVKILMIALSNVIRHPNSDISSDAANAIASITEGQNKQYEIQFDYIWIKALMKLLNSSDINVQTPAMMVLSDIINGTNSETKFALEMGIMKKMPEFFMSSEESIIRDALRILTSIIDGESESQTKMVFDSDLIPLVIYHLAQGSEEIQVEAMWAIFLVTTVGTPDQISYFIDMNVICPLCKLLLKSEKMDLTIVHSILTIFKNILSKAPNRNEEIFDKLTKCGCIEKISEFESHTDKEVKKAAFGILDFYCKGTQDTCPQHGF